MGGSDSRWLSDAGELEPVVLTRDGRVILSLEFDPSVSVMGITTMIRGGLTDIKPFGPSIAHLCEHLVARHGRVGGFSMSNVMLINGGIIQGSTHPFHTEYHIAFPIDESSGPQDLAVSLIDFWSNLHSQDFDAVAVETEIGLMKREIDDRLLSGLPTLFPWSEMFGTIMPELNERENLFLIMPTDAGSAVRQASSYLRSLANAETAISLSGPVPSESFAQQLREMGFVEQDPNRSWYIPFRGLDDTVARSVSRSVDGLQSPMYAEIFDLNRVLDAPAATLYATASMAASVLNNGSGRTLWRAGAFGPYSGPDSALLIYAGGTPLSIDSILPKIDGRALEGVRRQQISVLKRILDDPVARLRHLALGFLFGTSIENITAAIRNCSVETLSVVLTAIREQPGGRLAWLTDSGHPSSADAKSNKHQGEEEYLWRMT